MARLIWLLFMLAIVAALVLGASWAIAYNTVGTLLGAPPPQMGSQKTAFLWQSRPPAWRFAFGPTLIPGAPRVSIFVSPTGKIIRTEPADLASKLQAFRRTPY
jgi:hypothetical protein